MGYYTDYEMLPDLVSPDLVNIYLKETHQTIHEFIEGTKIDDWSYLSDVRRGEGAQLTWYDHQKDMSRLSAAFPDVLFTLCGHGEDAGDNWKEYYLRGKCQVAKGEIVYPEFDEKQLENIDTTCPSCYGEGVLHADGVPSIGCRKCWGTGEVKDGQRGVQCSNCLGFAHFCSAYNRAGDFRRLAHAKMLLSFAINIQEEK